MSKGSNSAKTRFLKSDDCKDATSLLLDYLAGTLPPKVKRAFERHLSICPDCVSFLNTYKKTLQLAQSFLRQNISAGKLARVERSLSRRLKRSKRPP
ncbi:MAG: zf-HC2 domain-containing protein [Deltaproteobacteria bacterium]|nr:zf-HC2 domain-containing protein [Deltaproteobacteria bacterium]